jgi:hypothetical protein
VIDSNANHLLKKIVRANHQDEVFLPLSLLLLLSQLLLLPLQFKLFLNRP